MAADRPPGIHWKSRKGTGRNQNLDAAAVLHAEHTTLAIVVDGFEINGHISDFGSQFAQGVIDAAASDGVADVASLIGTMRFIHESLRRQHIPQKFCFAALLIRDDLDIAWTIGLGDCRIGRSRRDGVQWLNPVHSLACATENSFDVRHADHSYRRYVTRRVGIRFDAPEVTAVAGVTDVKDASWILATDGYWVSRLQSDNQAFPGDDDTSVLLLTPPCNHDVCDSDTQNFYGRRLGYRTWPAF